ncbi:MAG: (d)CMP kinase [Alphaproteobacteria bacterium]|nr:(d)CMP kinase [Alphaproteobacteria bacterium]
MPRSRSRDERPKPFVVAIDGPAASGKGTLARRLAERFGFAHLDTGALYRATALLVLDAGGDPGDPAAAEGAARRVGPDHLADPRLRADEVAAAASLVAAVPEVRRALLAFQRNFAAHPPPPGRGAVLDGRDIGTVICPTADVKLFVTASTETRASRRLKELREQGLAVIYQDVLQDLTQRDARDRARHAAPLAPAPDAEIIDTTTLDADIVFERAAHLVARTLKEKEWQQ